MSGHSPSQDQDLRTALDEPMKEGIWYCSNGEMYFDKANLLMRLRADECRNMAKDPNYHSTRDSFSKEAAALEALIAAKPVRLGSTVPLDTPPAQAPDKAGEREGVADVGVSGPINGMGEPDKSGSYVRLSVSAHGFTRWHKISLGAAEVLSVELAGLLDGIAPQPNGTEASRGVISFEPTEDVVRLIAEAIAEADESDHSKLYEDNARAVIARLAALTPSAPIAAPVRTALLAAKQFIANGVEMGFIRMPDADTPDTAKDTPRLIDEALASLAAPVRDYGAREALLLEVLRDCRRTIANPNPGICCTVWFDDITTLQDHIDLALQQYDLTAPAPAGDVPGEAQTRQGWRREKLDKVVSTTVDTHLRKRFDPEQREDLVRGLLADFDDMTAGRHEFADCYAPEAQTQEGGQKAFERWFAKTSIGNGDRGPSRCAFLAGFAAATGTQERAL